jgi:hypothetical protein
MDKDNIDRRIEKATHSIDHIERVSPRPFFSTRLEARMLRESETWMRVSTFFTRPVIAFASVCFIVLLNLFIVFGDINPETTTAQQINEYPAADEYTLIATSLYDVEN